MSKGNRTQIDLSGDQSIDGLISGYAWNETSLTYSFPGDGAFYGFSYTQLNENQIGFLQANEAQQAALRYALDLIQRYTGLTFVEIEETATVHASIRLANSDVPPTAHAYYPSGSNADGDIWMGPTGPNYRTPEYGNWGLATIMHELGHALGLKHGHEDDGGGALPVNEDWWSYSIMTYRSYVGAPTDAVQGYVDSDNPTTFMQNDIAALQYMYGANYNWCAEDTVYWWDPEDGTLFINGVEQETPAFGKIFQTIWDGNGKDTYDLSGYSTHLTIDLAPGAFSTFNESSLADLDGYAPGTRLAAGNVANARLCQGDLRSLIENVKGGSNNDTIRGNSAANILEGGAGNDTLEGGAGDDRLDGGAGSDVAVFSGFRAEYDITQVGETFLVKDKIAMRDGIDTLIDIHSAQFMDGALVFGTNRAPALLSLSNNSVDAQGWTGMVIGELSAQDPDGDTISFSLLSNPNGLFAIDSGYLILAQPIPASTPGSLTVTVKASDPLGLSTTKDFAIVISGLSQNDDPVTPLDPVPPPQSENLRLVGTKGRNILTGGDGNDVLFGGFGNDKLTGGAGKDAFVFDTRPNGKKNLDILTDFQRAKDDLWLDNKVFTKLGKKGSETKPQKLNKKFFTLGTKAKDADDFLVYDRKKGILSYDADGAGGKAGVALAKLKKNSALKAADLFVI